MRVKEKVWGWLILMMNCMLALVATSCMDEKVETILNEADVIVDVNPDSAMILLAGIDVEKLSGDYSIARYNLVKTLAEFKKDGLVLHDSIVQPLYNFFMAEKQPTRERILVQFLLGHCYIKKAPSHALSLFEHVEKESMLLANGDYAALGAINRGMILSNINDDEGAKSNYLRALHLADSLHAHPRFAIIARENLSNQYSVDNEYEEAILQLDSACMIAEKEKLTGSLAGLYEERGVVRVCQMKYSEALKDFNMADSIAGGLDIRSRCLRALSAYAIKDAGATTMIEEVRHIEPGGTFDKLCVTTMELNLAYIDNDINRISELEKRKDELQNELYKEQQSILSIPSGLPFKGNPKGGLSMSRVLMVIGLVAILFLLSYFIWNRFHHKQDDQKKKGIALSQNDADSREERESLTLQDEIGQMVTCLDAEKSGVASAIVEENKEDASRSVLIGECFPMERMAAGKKLEEIRELLVRLFSKPSWEEVLDKKAKASAEQILKEFYTDALLDRLQKILDYAKEGVASEIESVHPLTPRNRRLIYLRLIGVRPQVMANIDCKTVNATSVQLSRIRNEIIAKSTPRQARFFSKYDL
jgi:tetratricopeptide (TPR) repeat protein